MALTFVSNSNLKNDTINQSIQNKKTNSMDCILVNYGVSLSKEERSAIRYGNDEEKIKALKNKIQTCTVPEFLAIDPKNLTNTEQKIQTALRKVYEINAKDPPLYEKFPNFRSDTCPLTIDITTVGLESDCSASYQPINNTIEFVEIDNPISLVGSIAHELKHAENETEELHELRERLKINNHYGLHQLRFLNEASASACEHRASYEAGDTEYNAYKFWHDTYAKNGWTWNEEEVREMEIRAQLGRLYDSGYKDVYDSAYPIGDNDMGLDHIPEVFRISDESTLKKLRETPRNARTPENRLKQASKNDDFDLYFEIVHDTLSKGEKINFDRLYFLNHCSDEQKKEILDLKTPDGKGYEFPEIKLEQLKKDDHVDEYVKLVFDALSNGQRFAFDSFYFLQHCSLTQLEQVLKMKQNDGKGYRIATHRLPTIFRNINLDSQRYLLTHTRDGEPLIDTETLVTYIAGYVAGDYPVEVGENFQEFLNYIKLTEKDCSVVAGFQGRKGLLAMVSHKSDIVDRLPKVMGLKDADGAPLISEQQLVQTLHGLHFAPDGIFRKASEAKKLFDCVSDNNGHLPVDRRLFDVQDHNPYEQKPGENILLRGASKEEAFDIVSLYMSLKDKNGKPIISPENIQAIPKEKRPLIAAIKAYKRQQFKDRFKSLLSFASKQTENHSQQSPAGVKRRTALKFDR